METGKKKKEEWKKGKGGMEKRNMRIRELNRINGKRKWKG
jgi:hypothetical protein